MSENGPREGTKDLPRRDPESGLRSVEADSASGRAYDLHAREERRRRDSLRDLIAQGLSPEEIVTRYGRDHPLERAVTVSEVQAAVDRTDPSESFPRPRRAE
ncbi:MAG TPA: hypothetical protein VMF04_04865 [Thermoplasmata archaeon]|nr:hypothetical protein [Thermoplasmata archaeon]